MSDIIRLLPDHVANQIAAGEVIQRPASVVKELLENAIDAESTAIQVIIRDGGRTLIQINDNGKGMSAMDARMCWERHATSKIRSVEDIFHIRTKGFRGEALASIASVAMVELKTKRAEDGVGTLIRIQGSEVKAQEAVATTDGTSIAVRNLFYNIPARRNFLKSDAVETRHVIDEFTRVALAHPEVSMQLHHNDNEVYVLKSGTLSRRIADLFSCEETGLLTVHETSTIATITGYVGKPEAAKKTRGEQFFFVNNRFIKDPYLNHAVVGCYENLIAREQFPMYVLNIEIDPGQIDVNVHPTKTEIKFEDERAVYHIIKASVRKSIGQQYHIDTYEPMAGTQLFGSSGSTPLNQDVAYGGRNLMHTTDKKDWEELFKVMQPETVGETGRNEQAFPQLNAIPEEAILLQVMQADNRFLIAKVKGGILLINQQLAHERILYDSFISASETAPIPTQQKLFPRSITVTAADEQIVLELLPQFRNLGIDIASFGSRTFILSGMPPEFDALNEEELILSLIEQYKQQSYASFSPHERLSRILARKLAVRNGEQLDQESMKHLVERLIACKHPEIAPDGTRCLRKIEAEELYKLLG